MYDGLTQGRVSVDKIWLKSYPSGVPAEINPDAYQSLVDVFEKSCQKYSDFPAFYNLGVTLSYKQIHEYAVIFAAFLQKILKLQKGDRFAIMLPNTLQYPIAMFGALEAGLTVVNVNPLYTAPELTHQLNDSGAKAIITLANFAHIVETSLLKTSTVKHVIVTHIGDLLPPLKAWVIHLVLKYIHKKIPSWHIPQAIDFKRALKIGKKETFSPVEINNQDIAFLQYTGGTTGVSKGAILTHRNLVANVEQAHAWFRPILKEKDEIIITALPLYHIFSLTGNCLFFTKLGGLNVLITNPRDIPAMIKEMRKFKFTAISGVNTLFNALIQNPDFVNLDFTKLHLALGGGMSVQQIVAERWQKITNAPLLEAYGLTEASPCVTINPADLKGYNGTIGLPVSSTDVCILDDTGKEVQIGQTGELAVKGPQVFQGYWQNPTETGRVFTKDGWLLTGDICSIDEQGYVRLLERKKDMIIVSGFNVYPNEVEDIIARIPGVREVAVIGVNDVKSGEVVKAFIVRENPQLTEMDILKFAKENLTPYKVPKKIQFCDDLPKTNVGKILRRALRDVANG